MLETAWESRWVPDPFVKYPRGLQIEQTCPSGRKKKVKPAKTDVLTPSSRELLLKLVFTSDQRSGAIRESDD